MHDHRVLPAIDVDPVTIEHAEGTLRIWRPRAHLVLTHATGRLVIEHSGPVMEHIEAAIAACPGDAVAVHDWLDVEGYQIGVHARMSPWAVKVAGSMRRIIVATSSPFVSVAVRTVNIATGNRFELPKDRPTVQSAIRQELQSHPR